MFLIILEGAVMCFALLLVCVVGMANGAVGLVTFYEKDVQERAIALGYTTQARIRKSTVIVLVALLLPQLVLTPAMVYGVNGAYTFWSGFWQMSAILWIQGVFDRLFIDWYWVGRTKAWVIPGTEDLMPYIPRRTLMAKWFGTIFINPLMAAAVAGVMALLR